MKRCIYLSLSQRFRANTFLKSSRNENIDEQRIMSALFFLFTQQTHVDRDKHFDDEAHKLFAQLNLEPGTLGVVVVL